MRVVEVVVVAGPHHSAAGNPVPNATDVLLLLLLLLVISRARTRSSPWGLHGHLVRVREVEEEGRGRGWGLRRRAVDGSRLREAPGPARAVAVAPESSAPFRTPVLCSLRRLRRPRLVE